MDVFRHSINVAMRYREADLGECVRCAGLRHDTFKAPIHLTGEDTEPP